MLPMIQKEKRNCCFHSKDCILVDSTKVKIELVRLSWTLMLKLSKLMLQSLMKLMSDITIKFYLKVTELETKMHYQDWILECQH